MPAISTGWEIVAGVAGTTSGGTTSGGNVSGSAGALGTSPVGSVAVVAAVAVGIEAAPAATALIVAEVIDETSVSALVGATG